MLTNQTVELAHEIAEAGSFSGKYFTVDNSSYLSLLFQSVALENVDHSDESLINASRIQTSALGSYEAIESTIAIQFSNIVSNIVNNARNVVKPLVDTLVVKIADATKNDLLMSTGLFKDIIQVNPPAILFDEQFINMITEFKDSVYPDMNGLCQLLNELNEALSSNELYQLAMSGSPVYDSKLNEVVNLDTIKVWVDTTTTPSDLPVNKAIILFSLLTGVLHRRLDQVSGYVDTIEKENKILYLRNGIGSALYHIVDEYTSDLERNLLFCKRPRLFQPNAILRGIVEKDKIYVYGSTYKNWVAHEGGSVEALLGYVSDKGLNTLSESDIRTNPSEYIEYYERKLKSLNIQKQINDANLVKKMTHSIMEEHLNLNYSDSKAEHVMYHERLALAMDHDYHGPNDLIPFLIKVVARTLFPSKFSAKHEINSSDVKDLLLHQYALTAHAENPDFEEALKVAIIRLISAKISNEISLVKRGN